MIAACLHDQVIYVCYHFHKCYDCCHAGALAGLIQGPRATSLTDGLSRSQISYSLPAQLPDPDQHMHEVYLAAQAAAAAAGNSQVRTMLCMSNFKSRLRTESVCMQCTHGH